MRHDDCMDRRALERLGHHVVSRRVALGYRNRTDLADSLQFTVRTLADIEHGVRKASPGTYAMLENKLAWAPGSIDTILAGGEPKETVVHTAPQHTHHPPRDTRCARPTPTPCPRPPPRNCCWSYDAASSPPATDATTPGTTGTAALTRTATGPNRASSQHLTDPLPDPDAVCRADAAVGNALTETAQLTGNRHQSMIHRSDHHADRRAQDGPRRAPRAA